MLIKEEFSNDVTDLLVKVYEYKRRVEDAITKKAEDVFKNGKKDKYIKEVYPNKLKAAILLLSTIEGILYCDSRCDWSGVMNDFQNVIEVYPDIMGDPGYDENGSL